MEQKLRKMGLSEDAIAQKTSDDDRRFESRSKIASWRHRLVDTVVTERKPNGNGYDESSDSDIMDESDEKRESVSQVDFRGVIKPDPCFEVDCDVIRESDTYLKGTYKEGVTNLLKCVMLSLSIFDIVTDAILFRYILYINLNVYAYACTLVLGT